MTDQIQEDVLESEELEPTTDAGDELAEMRNIYLRTLADYQNLLKQSARERAETIKYANQSLLDDLLPVYSNLKLALEHAGAEAGPWLEGVRFVTKQFKDALANAGVTEIETAGKPYDHNLMEALSEEETPDESLDGQVAREAAAGYTLNGRVLVPAKVVVYKAQK